MKLTILFLGPKEENLTYIIALLHAGHVIDQNQIKL
jgi:hypothetical protein